MGRSDGLSSGSHCPRRTLENGWFQGSRLCFPHVSPQVPRSRVTFSKMLELLVRGTVLTSRPECPSHGPVLVPSRTTTEKSLGMKVGITETVGSPRAPHTSRSPAVPLVHPPTSPDSPSIRLRRKGSLISPSLSTCTPLRVRGADRTEVRCIPSHSGSGALRGLRSDEAPTSEGRGGPTLVVLRRPPVPTT